MKLEIRAEITPVPLGRTHINTFNKGRFLNRQSQQFKRDLGFIASAVMQGRKLFAGALRAKIDLFKNVNPQSRKYGDADNHAKAILDALNGIIFEDDSQVVELQVVKHQSELQHLTIEIEELP